MKIQLNEEYNQLIEYLNSHNKCNVLEERDNVNQLYNSVTKEFISKGRFDVRGFKITNKDDLVAMLKMFRDTRFETFRLLYLKDNVVVGSDAVTSKIPNASSVLKRTQRMSSDDRTNTIRAFGAYRKKMERLNANGYLLVHNHPTGNLQPSTDDARIAQIFNQNLNGFKDSIIVGIDTYFSCKTYEEYPLNDGRVELNPALNNSSYILDFIKDMNHKSGWSILVYLDSQNRVRSVEEVKDTEFNDDGFLNYTKNRMRNIGSVLVVIVTYDIKTYNMLNSDMKVYNGVELILVSEDGKTYLSSDFNKDKMNSLKNKVNNKRYNR